VKNSSFPEKFDISSSLTSYYSNSKNYFSETFGTDECFYKKCFFKLCEELNYFYKSGN
jgi:hypothetical protein